MDEKPTEMKASEEILSKKELIKQILTDYPETRDSDRECCVRVWKKELPKIEHGKLHRVQWEMFPALYVMGEITLADSISRLKRLIQKEHPELRGINKDSEEQKCREIFIGELNFPNQ